jgi:hypothetical protein
MSRFLCISFLRNRLHFLPTILLRGTALRITARPLHVHFSNQLVVALSDLRSRRSPVGRELGAPPPAHAGESAADDKADISNALGDAFWDIGDVKQNGRDVPEDVGGVLSGL